MAQKTAPPDGFVRKENMILAICVAFAIGFFGGIALTVYKSGPAKTSAPTSASAPGVQKMIDSLEAEVKNNPNSTSAWIQLGNTYFDNNKYAQAITAYEKALALAPNNADVTTDLGVMYRRNKQPLKAVEAFDRAIAIDPKHEVSRFNKGIVLMHDLKDPQGAIKAWEALVEVNPVAMAPNGQSVDELLQQYKKSIAAGSK